MSDLYDLPSRWKWIKLGDSYICEKITDGTHKSPKTIDIGMPYITVKDISNKGTIDFKNCKFISNNDYETLVKSNCQPQYGDVLFSKDGTVGKVSLIDYEKKFVVLSSLAILRPSKNISPYYLKYYLLSPYFFENAIKSKTGAAIKRVVLRTIKNLDIPVPLFDEQQRIVSKLDNLFEKIDKAIELHQKNIYEVNVFMKSVLNDVFGELEEKYPKIKFDEVCNKITDGSHNPPKGIETSEFLMLSSKNVFNNSINFDSPRYLKEEDFIKENKRTDINKGDVLLTIVGTIGRTAVVNLERKFVLQRSVAVLKPKKNLLDSYFLMYSLQKNLDILMSGAKGAAQKGIYLKSIKNLEIVNLPLNIQQEVVKYLNEVSQKIEKIKLIQKEKMENLKALKASILDKAFKGKL
ncbi:restriction endonuclease subunit S [Malaciobacter canalis]|uniref:restriction endonuclease subunit S n=1 Tax=Malaciobacter canalis TaxID=1912871 RepID=UPI00384F478B